MDISANRSANGTVLTVRWQPLSLEDAGGFYKTFLTVSTNDQRRRQNIQFSKKVPFTQSSAAFVGLDPSIQYSLTIAVIATDGIGNELEGPSSEPFEIAAVSSGNGVETGNGMYIIAFYNLFSTFR